MPGHLARGGTESEKQRQTGNKTQPVPQEKNSGNGRQTGKPREERGEDSPTQKDAGHEQQAGRGRNQAHRRAVIRKEPRRETPG